MTRPLVLLLIGLGAAGPAASGRSAVAADHPFTIAIEEVEGVGAPGLQGFAVARAADGRWLCLGGRRAGLHGRHGPGFPPPLANFDHLNDRIWVIDPTGKTVASRALADVVSRAVADSLAVVHPQAVQVGDRLYVVGGYGRVTGQNTMSTFRRLTVVDVSEVADAVEGGGPVGDHIRQSAPEAFLRVTGGELVARDDTFYLVFGQRFDVNYTEATEGHYTHQVRPFQVQDTGTTVTVVEATAVGSAATDAEFRRRDLNVLPAIRPDGGLGWTAFGGVFSEPGRRAWERPIDIDPGDAGLSVGVEPTGFRQRLSQYNCAAMPAHDAASGSMAAVFFGGISAVVVEADGTFRRDDELPFVDHVVCVTRSDDGAFAEALVSQGGGADPPTPLRMPALLGASARFIPADPALFPRGVLELDGLGGETVVGHIYGGIAAAVGNDGPTGASPRIFEVHVSPVPSPAIPVPALIPLVAPSKGLSP